MALPITTGSVYYAGIKIHETASSGSWRFFCMPATILSASTIIDGEVFRKIDGIEGSVRAGGKDAVYVGFDLEQVELMVQ
jgi:hypothetical protein